MHDEIMSGQLGGVALQMRILHTSLRPRLTDS